MHTKHRQHEIRGFSRGLYQFASRFVRCARYSEARRGDIRVVQRMFPGRSPWRQAVKAACKAHGMDFEAGCVDAKGEMR